MASTYATRTVGTATNNNKFTISVWSKRSKLTGDYQGILTSRGSGWNAGIGLYWGNDESVWYNFSTSSTALATVSTTAKYRDVNGWYHIVIAGDTTQSGTNKLKIWVNGEQQTSFTNDDRSSFVGLSNDLGHTGYPMQLGRKYDGSYYYDGSMSHLHFIDGTAYDASAFGSTDSTTGEWKINTSPSVTYGTNGFFILKDGNSVTDQSGNSNNLTVGGGTLTKTEDNPSNVFATMNPLSSYYFGGTFSNGNNKIVTNAGNESYAITTLGVSSGKYYWEVKDLATQNYEFIGIVDQPASATNFASYQNSNAISYYSRTGGYVLSGGASQTYGNTYNTNDIIGVALDLDNNKLYFSKNGTWQNSGDPTSGATGTGAISISSTPSDGVWYAQAGEIYTSSSTFEFNFGNGYFGTTAVSSAGTNASGIGIFEYDVPTGYTALSTKGLNL